MSKDHNPLLAAVKPLAKQYINAERISDIFSQVTGQYDIAPGEKAAIIISLSPEGDVRGAVYGITGTDIASQYSERVPLDQLIMQLLN